jgi:threonine dehydrogenase-like Zn-dependent dehydrogenase
MHCARRVDVDGFVEFVLGTVSGARVAGSTGAYMSTGQLQTSPLITHRFPLSQACRAWETMQAGAEFFNKVILVPGEEVANEV